MAEQNTPGANVDGQNGNGAKRKRILTILATVVGATLLVYGVYWLFVGQYREVTEDAYVGGNVVSMAPRISGTVESVNVDDTDFVHAGDVLVQLDPSDADVALEQAKATLAQTVRKVRQLYDQAQGLKATLALRQASLDQARRDYQRAEGLSKVRGISTQDFQHAQTALHTAQAAYNEARHQYAASQAAVSGIALEQHPQVKLAESGLRQAWLNAQRTRIVAPVDGYIAQRHVQVGQQVSPATQLMAVIPLDQVWVDANFKETDLRHMRIGQPVTLVTDLYGGSHEYHGKVAGLAAGTGSAFALLPAQNATGNWIKVVQRVPVRITIDAKDLDGYPLRIGLSTEATVNTRDRDGDSLAKTPASGARFSTPVFAPDNTELDALIQSIVQANSGDSAATDKQS